MTSLSFDTAIQNPATAATLDPARIKVYNPKQSKQWLFGALGIVFGLLGLFPLRSALDWLSGGPIPDGRTFTAMLVLLFVPLGILQIVNALRGLPRLTVTPGGIKFDNTFGAKWASWDSLDSFEIRTTYVSRFNRQVLTGTARIVGPNASRVPLRQKSFSVPDSFLTPIDTIVDELNAARAAAVGASESLVPSTNEDLPVGLAELKLPWLTLAILAVLIEIFVVENMFPVTPGAALSPSVETLLAMGGLSHAAVLSNGEWYRLFTAPLLHGGIVHILGNGVALLLGGRLLERLVGRLWFFAFFVIGALGGSLMSLAVGPDNLISVGASGALMGMFAALFVGAFRLAAGTQARQRLQTSSIQVLIPSLLPLFSTTAIGRIDYGAHFGGALSGAILAVLLLKAWPQAQRIPQLRTVAAGISIVGALLFVTSAGIAVGNYSKYDVVLIPQEEMPTSAADRQARGAGLAEQYPDDPRSHFYLAEALAASKDEAGAERELRVALDDAQRHSVMFRPQLEFAIRSALAGFLAEQGRQDEAKDIAHPVCSAAGDKDIDNLLKLVVSQHLCD
jgi:rhomboid protease GluP